MKVELIERIDGREVVSLNQLISGQAVDIKQQTEALKDRVGQAVLPAAFFELDGNSGGPVTVESRCTATGTRCVTVMSQSGEIDFKCR